MTAEEKRKKYMKEYGKKYRQDHKEYFAEYNKVYQQENKDRINVVSQEWKKKNPDKVKAARDRRKGQKKIDDKKYNLKNKDRLAAKSHERYMAQKDVRKEYLKENKDWINQRERDRYKNDPAYKLKKTVRARVLSFTKLIGLPKWGSTMDIIGCTPDELWVHIESQFKPGMTRENYGRHTWHIDHKIPLSSAVTPDDVKRLCHYTNLRPMWATENLRKHAKIQ